MKKRLRITGYQVLPVMQTDDGENLAPPLQVQPVFVSSTDWPNVQTLMAESIETVRRQVEGEVAPESGSENVQAAATKPKRG